MGTLITTLSSAAPRMTPGERRLAQRLQQKLDADYLVWFDVPVGPMRTHPDFVVLHPSRGVLILEVKDWALPSSNGSIGRCGTSSRTGDTSG